MTGARVKIGYYAALMLLRNGCEVIALTRFPKDAAERYQREDDFESFKHRLSIYGVDLRHTPSVQTLSDHLCQTRDTLDFVIHNACQTVRRPPNFYQHLMDGERESASGDVRKLLEGHLQTAHALADSAELTQVSTSADLLLGDASQIFPSGALDQDLQQIDLRAHNSWRLTHQEVPTLELLEVLLVNAVAPFVMSARLRPLLVKSPTFDRHIVNVSAVEGQFYRAHKTDKHPHTNMAKAALNMLTRTSATTWLEYGVHMNAVDTGWVTDEDPVHLAKQKVKEHRFSPPLDVVDGAARIVDPIFSGINTGAHAHGQFFKDYAPTPW